jgi:hypothetical protein
MIGLTTVVEAAMKAALAGALLLATPACVREARASGHGAESHGGDHAVEEIDESVDVKDRGVGLGDYRIRAYYPVEAQKSTVRFVLYAKVAKDRYQEISQLVSNRKHKLRDQVIVATRMTPLGMFDEPDLESFRRRILMRLKRAVPELEIDDVYVSDFQLEVQSL